MCLPYNFLLINSLSFVVSIYKLLYFPQHLFFDTLLLFFVYFFPLAIKFVLFLSLFFILYFFHTFCQFQVYFLLFYLIFLYVYYMALINWGHCLIYTVILREMLSQNFHLFCDSIFLPKLQVFLIFHLSFFIIPLYLWCVSFLFIASCN